MFSRFRLKPLILAEIVALASAVLMVLVVAGPVGFGRLSTWGALLVTAAGTAALTLLAAQRHEAALANMIDTADEVARGDEKMRFRENHQGELGRLAIALDEMRQAMVGARHKLGEDNRQLTSVLQSMSDGVIAVDRSHRVTLFNEATRNLLRLTAQDTVGRPLLEATRCRPLHDAVVQTLSRPGPLTTEFQVSESSRFLLLRANRLPGDPCPGVVVVLHDVTELRRLENLRREFVANVSHELKTPLASIKAYAETLLGGAVNDAEHNIAFVQRIANDADRLHQLIIDMLQIARIESQQQAFQITDVELAPLARRCAEEMQPHAEAKEIRLTVESPERPIVVRVDTEGLHTVLANLVDNAIKYTPVGGSVAIRLSSADDSGIVDVEDDGPGIDRAHQARIFERFYRVDRARGRDAGGTGLGLSIVKHLVQAFDGSISVSSQLGQGSTFQVRLPLGNRQIAAT